MGIVFGLGIYGAVAPPGALEGRNVLDMTIYGLKMMVSAAGTPKNRHPHRGGLCKFIFRLRSAYDKGKTQRGGLYLSSWLCYICR